MMRQLTIRGFDEELERQLRSLARERGLSLNRAALLLLRRGAGLDREGAAAHPAQAVGSALDRFVGSWSKEQESELLEALEPLEQIDPELWR